MAVPGAERTIAIRGVSRVNKVLPDKDAVVLCELDGKTSTPRIVIRKIKALKRRGR
jgi:hypothetical protein